MHMDFGYSAEVVLMQKRLQTFGAIGLTPDTPLSYQWTWGRAMHFLDGPDELHLRVVARHQLGLARKNIGCTAPFGLTPSN